MAIEVLCTKERGCWTLSAGEQGCKMILHRCSFGCWGFVTFFAFHFRHLLYQPLSIRNAFGFSPGLKIALLYYPVMFW